MKKPPIISLLKKHPKAVVHLRRQINNKRFSLVLGSGISRDFGVPDWKKLINRVSTDPEIDGDQILTGDVKTASLRYKAQLLFQHFKGERHDDIKPELMRLAAVNSSWRDLCRKHIYSSTPPLEKFPDSYETHPYFRSLIRVIKKSLLTINYNFDDFVERALYLDRSDGSLGFEVVVDPWPQFKRENSVIYHPHGFIPNPNWPMERPADKLVFSESGYSDQYIGAKGYDSSFLDLHLSRNTCLFLGCSLEDELKNALMRGSYINPGSYHYYIHFVKSTKSGPSGDQKKRIFETNFNVYNLITLFLCPSEINSLLRAINNEDVSDIFLAETARNNSINIKYNYYLTGALGVGKSTSASYLRSLHVLDEWMDPRPEVLLRDWKDLNDQERAEADSWIIKQFSAKNRVLHKFEYGISVIDRPPLDPLAFTEKVDWPQKAHSLLSEICKETESGVESGMVIRLTGDPEVLAARVRARGKSNYDVQKLGTMQRDVESVYDDPGVHVVDTKNLSASQVMKIISRKIYCDDYHPVDLMAMLSRYSLVQ